MWVRIAHAPLVTIGICRLLGAGILTLVWILLKSEKTPSTPAKLLQSFKSRWAWITGFLFFLHLWTYMEAVQTTSVAHLVLIFSSSPIFTAIGSFLFYRDRFRREYFLVYSLAIAGILLLFQDHSSSAVSTLHGDIFALVSAALHSAYALSGKKARETLDNSHFTSLLYLSSGAFFLCWALLFGQPLFVAGLSFQAGVWGLIVFPTLLGHTLYAYLLKHLNINFLSCAKLLEPGLSTLMAYWILGENLGAQDLLAYLLIGSAVLILFWPKKAALP